MTNKPITDDNGNPHPATEEGQAKAEAPATKTLRATFHVHRDVRQNDLKDFIKSCPMSVEGGQTIAWAEDAEYDELVAEVAIVVPADTDADTFNDWLRTCPHVAGGHKISRTLENGDNVILGIPPAMQDDKEEAA